MDTEKIEHHHSSQTAGITLGTVGTTLGGLAVLGGIAGRAIGGIMGNCTAVAPANVATFDNRVLAEKDAEIAQLKSEKYSDKSVLELYKYIDGENKAMTAYLGQLSTRVSAIETSLPLREQILDGKIAQVAQTADCCCKATNTAIANMQATLAEITKVVVPLTAVCPKPAVATVQ